MRGGGADQSWISVKKVVTVRPNNIRSEFFLGDLEAIVQGAVDRFHGIILPKVHGPDDIKYVSRPVG